MLSDQVLPHHQGGGVETPAASQLAPAMEGRQGSAATQRTGGDRTGYAGLNWWVSLPSTAFLRIKATLRPVPDRRSQARSFPHRPRHAALTRSLLRRCHRRLNGQAGRRPADRHKSDTEKGHTMSEIILTDEKAHTLVTNQTITHLNEARMSVAYAATCHYDLDAVGKS